MRDSNETEFAKDSTCLRKKLFLFLSAPPIEQALLTAFEKVVLDDHGLVIFCIAYATETRRERRGGAEFVLLPADFFESFVQPLWLGVNVSPHVQAESVVWLFRGE